MAKKEDRKKQKKRLREKKRAADQRLHQAALEHAKKYPSIRVVPTGGDPAFVAVIEELVAAFAFDDPACCPDDLRAVYRKIAELGFEGYCRKISVELSDRTSSRREALAIFEQHARYAFCHFGEWLFGKLPGRFKDCPPPTYFFRTKLTQARIEVRFDLLEAVGEPENPLYIPPDKPTVLMQGARWQVGLYRHALERLCGRLQETKTRAFLDNFHVHYLLTRQRLAYEPVLLADGSHALRVDMKLPLTTAAYDYYSYYTRAILGLPETHLFTERDELFAVMGYLPLQVQGKYARAKTFLLPGFANTPENALGRRKASSPQERLLLQAMTDESLRSVDLDGETIKAIRWYHDNGVPQIFRRERSPSESDP